MRKLCMVCCITVLGMLFMASIAFAEGGVFPYNPALKVFSPVVHSVALVTDVFRMPMWGYKRQNDEMTRQNIAFLRGGKPMPNKHASFEGVMLPVWGGVKGELSIIEQAGSRIYGALQEVMTPYSDKQYAPGFFETSDFAIGAWESDTANVCKIIGGAAGGAGTAFGWFAWLGPYSWKTAMVTSGAIGYGLMHVNTGFEQAKKLI